VLLNFLCSSPRVLFSLLLSSQPSFLLFIVRDLLALDKQIPTIDACHAKLAAYERELIRLVQAVCHWRAYLWGHSFIIKPTTIVSSSCWTKGCSAYRNTNGPANFLASTSVSSSSLGRPTSWQTHCRATTWKQEGRQGPLQGYLQAI
jgi:hypothetical protein